MHVDTEALPPSLRHVVEQTIAAEKLEGWQPTDENTAALVALVLEEVSYGEYLSKFRCRYPTPGPSPRYRTIFRRTRPYFLPGTTLLRNNFGAETHDMLADLEFVATAGRIAQWHRRLADGRIDEADIDVRAIHQHVFGDVYPWAGQYRVVELRRGETGFVWQSAVDRQMAVIEDSARALAAGGVDVDDDALAYQLARLYADYNHVHPFREGNGRTGTLMLHSVTTLAGRRLDLSSVTRDDWYAAARDSMPFRRDGQPSHRPFQPLFMRALG